MRIVAPFGLLPGDSLEMSLLQGRQAIGLVFLGIFVTPHSDVNEVHQADDGGTDPRQSHLTALFMG